MERNKYCSICPRDTSQQPTNGLCTHCKNTISHYIILVWVQFICFIWKVLALSLPLSRLKKVKASFCQKQSHLKLSPCFKIWKLTGTGNCNIWLSDKDIIISLHLEFIGISSDEEFQKFKESYIKKSILIYIVMFLRDKLQGSGNGRVKVVQL